MEVTAIVGFLLGTVAGAFSGLLIIARDRTKIVRRKPSSMIKLANVGSRSVQRQNKTPRVGLGIPRSSPVKTDTIPFIAVGESSRSQVGPRATALTCPACGLEAPESLMVEHFNGSPSHKNASPKPHPKLQPIVAVSEPSVAAPLLSEASDDAVRQLLQMLVPPRAFGRRHGQRTIDPLSSLVQSIGSRKNPV